MPPHMFLRSIDIITKKSTYFEPIAKRAHEMASMMMSTESERKDVCVVETSKVDPSEKHTSNNTSGVTSEKMDVGVAGSDETKQLSKNQLKRKRKWERAMEVKARRKKQEREAKIAKALAEGRDLEEERKLLEQRTLEGEGKQRRQCKWEESRLPHAQKSFEVYVDCSFESEMTAKEIGSLASQIRYCYSANKRSPRPCFLSICSLGGETLKHLQNVSGFHEWTQRAFRFTEKPLDQYYSDNNNNDDNHSENKHQNKNTNNNENNNNHDNNNNHKSNQQDVEDTTTANDTKQASTSPPPSPPPPPPKTTTTATKKQLVYLTSDSENIIETLDNNAIYIIGGIVDRNRLKRAAITRAEQFNIKTAKLPLDQHLQKLQSTRVLACNHVFDILLKYKETDGDWGKALLQVLPNRKDARLLSETQEEEQQQEDQKRDKKKDHQKEQQKQEGPKQD